MSSLMTEIEEVIRGALDAGQIVEAAWVTQSVMLTHVEIEGPDADWYLAIARQHVRDSVNKVISRYRPKETDGDDPQLVLTGFDRLQKAYMVKRGDKNVIVPVEQCTDRELRDRANDYRRMARGCEDHAHELNRYVEDRAASQSAA